MADDDSAKRRPSVTELVASTQNSTVNTQDMFRVLHELAEPWAAADRAKAVEETKRAVEETKRAEIQAGQETKRAEIHAGVQKYNAIVGGVVLVGVLVLAAIALLKGDKEIAREVLIALVAAAGGYGLGTRAKKKDD